MALSTFLKGSSNPKDGMPGCANYDHYYGGCLLEGDCRVEKEARCGYFERAVLPTARHLSQTDRIYGKYEAKVGLTFTPLPRGQAQGCPICGGEKEFGQNYCRQCTFDRRRKATEKARIQRRARDRNENMPDTGFPPESDVSDEFDAPDSPSVRPVAQNGLFEQQ